MKPKQQTNINLTVRKAIRRAMKADYKSYKGKGGYDAVGAVWGVSGGLVWKINKNKEYWPKDKKILLALEIRARIIGIPFPRKREDLFSMKPAELKRRLDEREVVNG